MFCLVLLCLNKNITVKENDFFLRKIRCLFAHFQWFNLKYCFVDQNPTPKQSWINPLNNFKSMAKYPSFSYGFIFAVMSSRDSLCKFSIAFNHNIKMSPTSDSTNILVFAIHDLHHKILLLFIFFIFYVTKLS